MSTENFDEMTDDEMHEFVTRNIMDNLVERTKAWNKAHDEGLRIDYMGRTVDRADAFVPIKKTCVICTGISVLPDGRPYKRCPIGEPNIHDYLCKHYPVGEPNVHDYTCTEFTLDSHFKSNVKWRD